MVGFTLFALACVPFTELIAASSEGQFEGAIATVKKSIYIPNNSKPRRTSAIQFEQTKQIALACQDVYETVPLGTDFKDITAERERSQKIREEFEGRIRVGNKFFRSFSRIILSKSQTALWTLPAIHILFTLCMAMNKKEGTSLSDRRQACLDTFLSMGNSCLFIESRPDIAQDDLRRIELLFESCGIFASDVWFIADGSGQDEGDDRETTARLQSHIQEAIESRRTVVETAVLNPLIRLAESGIDKRTVSIFWEGCGEFIDSYVSNGGTDSNLATARNDFIESFVSNFLICTSFCNLESSLLAPDDSWTLSISTLVKDLRRNMFLHPIDPSNKTKSIPPSQRIDIGRLWWSRIGPNICRFSGCTLWTVTSKTCGTCRKPCHLACGYEMRNNLELPQGASPIEASSCSKRCWESFVRIYTAAEADSDFSIEISQEE